MTPPRTAAPTVAERLALLHQDVGQGLRARREEQGVSLRELARRVGVSPSALSQIETGKSRPSVSTLYAIVSELRMSLDDLFGSIEAPASPTAARRRARAASATGTGRGVAAAAEQGRVQRAGSRTAIELESGVHWERLTPTADPDVDFLAVTYDVGGASSHDGVLIRHPGREYGLVLTGELEVTVGFDTCVLGPGDSISFESTTPHRLRNAGDVPVEGVWIVIGRHETNPLDERRRST
jgi:transcriptional regulator with XRE-family HTH domain